MRLFIPFRVDLCNFFEKYFEFLVIKMKFIKNYLYSNYR